jgi:hypothetical protein
VSDSKRRSRTVLQFHPAKRITVEGAMAHQYFDSVRSQYTDPEPALPMGAGGFDFAFETDDSLVAAGQSLLLCRPLTLPSAHHRMFRAPLTIVAQTTSG